MTCKAPTTIGEMRTPVTFQRATLTSDGAGGNTRTWSTLAGSPSRAKVRALSGHERYQSARTEAMSKHRVTCRYFSGLKESDAILINGERHNIRFINNVDMANKWLIIDTDRGAAT